MTLMEEFERFRLYWWDNKLNPAAWDWLCSTISHLESECRAQTERVRTEEAERDAAVEENKVLGRALDIMDGQLSAMVWWAGKESYIAQARAELAKEQGHD